MYIVYILYSSVIDKFYSGQTKDLNRRLEEHNRGKTSFSAKGMPWDLVFSRVCSSRTEAVRLERFIKNRGAARFQNDNNIKVG
jgi:putative endonuclease